MATPLDLILSGKLIEGALAVYTNVMGSWFWLFFFALPAIMIYLKTQSIEASAITLLLLYSVLMPVLPPAAAQHLPAIIIVVSAIIIWRLIKRS